MLTYNLLISCSYREFRDAKKEINEILKKLGDEEPIIEGTIARGIIGVKTTLDARDVVKKVKEMHEKREHSLEFAIKWVPIDLWVSSEIDDWKAGIEKLKHKINPDDKWAMVVEKRRYDKMHSDEIIKELAELIENKVDLDNPDKIVRLDIMGNHTAISILKPDEVFSIGLRV